MGGGRRGRGEGERKEGGSDQGKRILRIGTDANINTPGRCCHGVVRGGERGEGGRRGEEPGRGMLPGYNSS